MILRIATVLALISLLLSFPADAEVIARVQTHFNVTIESVYTTLDPQKDCEWDFSQTGGEIAKGSSAVCTGFEQYPVYMTEGDARKFVAFGPVEDAMEYRGGFGNFNSVNDVLEWRLEDGKPYATILRWFVRVGDAQGNRWNREMLVVSTVADPARDPAERTSCQVAFIDAELNPNANLLARQVAHLAAKNFRCEEDVPTYVGIRGPNSGWLMEPHERLDEDLHEWEEHDHDIEE